MIDSRVARAGMAAVVIATVGIAAVPASAQGFFDQLFGGGAVQPSQPSFSYEPAQPAPDLGTPLVPLHRKKMAVVHKEPIPQRQKTTDLWHDKTLQSGDAVMMKDGLHVYSGPESLKHTAKQFVPLDRARHVASQARSALVAVNVPRGVSSTDGRKTDTLASGRSVATSTPLTKGFKITDARGASIRYVGP